MTTKNKICFFILTILYACTNNTINDVSSTEYYDVPFLGSKKTNENVKDISLEEVLVDSNLNSSFVGDLWVNNNNLYFSDSYFNFVFHLDLNGNLLNTYLGKGESPSEIADLDDVVSNYDNGVTILSSYTSEISNFDNSWNRIGKSVIDFKMKRNYNEVLENPEPSLPESYELETGYKDILKVWDEDFVAIAVSSSHPDFNGYFNSELFYKYSRVIALINKKNGDIETFFGRRSPYYLSKINIPNFNHFKYEIDNENVYICFMPDKYIYIINKESKLATGKFGISGRDMNTNYFKTNTYEQAEDNIINDLKGYGYYNDLKIISEDDLIFRSYTKGDGFKSDGLQIYKNYVLIADLDVPKGFKIIGKIDDFFIGSNRNDGTEEQIIIYKVKLKYEN